MTFSLFVDPGELKSSSKFRRCKGIGDFKPIPLPGLEEMTGADIIISPANLPKPMNRHLLKIHLNEGALLVQLKFGFDLIASIVDNRLKSSQAKMLATGASQSQIILIFIGLIFEPEKESSELMVNGKYVRSIVPAAKNLRYEHYLEQRLKWSLRGGVFEQITLNDSLAVWINSAAKVAFNEPANKQVWEPQQKLYLVDDWRNVMVNLPGIGEQKAQDVYDWLEDKSFYGFMAALEDESLMRVPGIGLGIIKKIKSYLKGK